MDNRPTLVVAFNVDQTSRTMVAATLAGTADAVYLAEVADADRARVLRGAGALLSRNTAKDLRPGEAELLADTRLIQFMTAGVDYIPLGALPQVPIATNGGAYAEPMAEHALAMMFAAGKRLIVEHENLKGGRFNQFTPTRMMAGLTCGILGFGGIGAATARLLRNVGMRVHAINRRGVADVPVDWIGTPDRLGEMLAASDVLVIATPLTRTTRGMIGKAELAQMKDDAILVNLARGEIVQEKALYDHLVAHPRFTACIDAWWIEPVRHGEFRMDQPFLDLPNVIASPHNSAMAGPAREVSLRRAVENCRRALSGETPLHLIGADDKMM